MGRPSCEEEPPSLSLVCVTLARAWLCRASPDSSCQGPGSALPPGQAPPHSRVVPAAVPIAHFPSAWYSVCWGQTAAPSDSPLHPGERTGWLSPSPPSSTPQWDAVPETIWCLFLSLADFSSQLSAKWSASSLCASLMFLPCMNDISHWENICFLVRTLGMLTGSSDDNHVLQVNSFSECTAGKELRLSHDGSLLRLQLLGLGREDLHLVLPGIRDGPQSTVPARTAGLKWRRPTPCRWGQSLALLPDHTQDKPV